MNIHGQAVLQARRLVEAGVPLVTVFWQNDGITNVSVYWDTHSRNFIDLKTRLCPVTDQAFTALLEDLEAARHARRDAGRLDRRDGPHAARRPERAGRRGRGRDGRDHWAERVHDRAGRRRHPGGVVHGSSDRYAAYPATNPTTPADLAATVYHCLGVDPQTAAARPARPAADAVRGQADRGGAALTARAENRDFSVCALHFRWPAE